ncbi:hypothetical protein ACFX4N_23905 [Priestia sp. YIM B13551]|uniref:hypothetical protein n=1 Tax=Priestia sp. YIM B13551 TaxID=3366306 RepID=UPI00366F96DF
MIMSHLTVEQHQALVKVLEGLTTNGRPRMELMALIEEYDLLTLIGKKYYSKNITKS